MKNAWGLVFALLLVVPPWMARGAVIPISDVNADDPITGQPVLKSQVVTVKGVVTIGTGSLAASNDIYVQDATGGVNVSQTPGASPVVAAGDSVRVTGRVDVNIGDRTYLWVNFGAVPGSRIEVLGSGYPLPEPVVLTAHDLDDSTGESHEGIYAVMRNVFLPFPSQWPAGPCPGYQAAYVADADTCWLWFDGDAGLCGSAPPLERFDVYGVVIPEPSPEWDGYGMLPPARSSLLSRGSGSGFATLEPEWVYTRDAVDLEFALAGEADTLTRVAVAIPEGWSFSGSPDDVSFAGEAFSGAFVVADSTAADIVTVAGAALARDASGTITIGDVEAPAAAGTSLFEVATAIPGGALVALADTLEIDVESLAEPGQILVNEVYAFSDATVDDQDRAEFVELVNPGPDTVDISGWVITDLDDGGLCGGTNLWQFPYSPRTLLGPNEYLVVVKDAYQRPYTRGFLPVFADSVDLASLQIFEMVDPDYADDSDWTGNATWPDVPNMILASPTDESLSTSQEIRLVGGLDGNGPLVANLPSCEAVYLYSDRAQGVLVDAMEYRSPVFRSSDYCAGEGLGGANDAYVPGPPPSHYSLGRDGLSTDTDVSAHDFILSSWPTPGGPNVAEDRRPPALARVEAAGSQFAVVEFNEAIDGDEAIDLSNYEFSGGLEIRNAWLSRDERTVLLMTSPQESNETYILSVYEMADLAGNVMRPDSATMPGYYDVITPIGDIQAYDANGYSPFWGQDAIVVGFTTVPPGVFQPGRTNMYIQDVEGYGINIYSRNLMTYPALEGDLVKAGGLVLEYRSVDSNNPWTIPPGSTTEISNATISVLARGFDVIEPEVLPTGETNSEDKEGTLIETAGIVVSLEGFAFYIDDGSGACQVYQNFSGLDFSTYAVGDSVRVTGVLLQYDYTMPYFGGYELAPRYNSDLEELSTSYTENASVSTVARVLDAGSDDSIEISYNAPAVSHVVVRIFDLQGRAVATLYDGLSLGPSHAAWDGRDDAGKKVPPGVYVCHVQARSRSGGDVSDTAVPIVVGMKLE